MVQCGEAQWCVVVFTAFTMDEIIAVALFSMVGLGSVLNFVGRREDGQLIATLYRHEPAVALLKRAPSLVKYDHLQYGDIFLMTP